MQSHRFGVLSIALVVLATMVFRPAQFQDAADESIRIGVYDNRAIAIAYASSRFNPVGEKMKEFEAARERGDEVTIRDLEAWGQAHQRQLHRQGFGRVPVADLLEHVKEALPELAARLDLDAIVFEVDHLAPGATEPEPAAPEVDITMDLGMLLDPPETAIRNAKEVVKHPAIDLDEIEQLNTKHR